MALLESPAPVASRRPAGSVDLRTQAEARRHELASFLRNRRERITPEQVGLPVAGRRRTPGLRREEVAQLAGVGVTWYTWLEQGRDIAPSPQVLDAISRTLRLDLHERTHLFRLSGAPDPDHVDGCHAVPDTVRLLLDQLEPFPAAVVNGRYDLLAYNRTYQAVTGDLDSLPPGDRNALWRLFTDPQVRATVVDWEEAAQQMVASFRAAMAKHLGEPAWKCFLSRMLTASAEFAQIWERHEVRPIQRMTKRMFSPAVGLLQLESTSLWVAESVGVRLITYTPIDDETRGRLETLYAATMSPS
ncbi:MAG: helix-turn-helix transcriptional regulator [Actinomycetes bacterium]